MRFLFFIASPCLAILFGLAFWLAFGACIDTPSHDLPPIARIVVSWDPLACGEPHRVAVELQDDDGTPISKSVPCGLGGMMLDAPHYGIYRGRIYSWRAGEPIRAVTRIYLAVDEPVVYWLVATPD